MRGPRVHPVKLNHVTHYRYDRPVSLSPQVVRLRPAPHCRTPILAYALKVEPAGHFINWQQDPQSNYLAAWSSPRRPPSCVSRSTWWPSCRSSTPSTSSSSPRPADSLRLRRGPERRARALPPEGAGRRAGAEVPRLPRVHPARALRQRRFPGALNQRLQQDIRYLVRLEPGVQTPEETLTLASGSCRDSAWLLVQLLRHLGLARASCPAT
jgi:Transglutaminase-like enzymes, putative cysteine proteases